ncbi:intercellular adhesion molecule 1-like [Oncorhynchus kisutch]|uniref:intercellular adhesion molecule 1-like n=1 Tax=Oncorhynchus kisutch TaxID=8019 RepID=UPI0012DCA378|nr:intercellular adhesion molecule 1-like [Oncorhynchus kisutch]
MARRSRVDGCQVQVQLQEEPLAVRSRPIVFLGKGETNPTGTRRKRGVYWRSRLCWWRCWENSLSLPAVHCLGNVVHRGAKMVEHCCVLLDALLHPYTRGRPTHASSLVLNPPRVVLRYGDSVSVNCSTSSTDHEGIGWEDTFGGTSFEQDVNIVTWTVDNLTDWTIEPTCYITLIDSKQPSKVLPVILYNTPDSVSISVLRHSGPMVEGTQYQLQCDIQNIAPLQNLVVKWYKGNEPLDNVTYSTVSKTPVDVSNTLMISPSRDDDGAQYRCRAELDLGPEGPQPHPTVTSEPLSITVHYPPNLFQT